MPGAILVIGQLFLSRQCREAEDPDGSGTIGGPCRTLEARA